MLHIQNICFQYPSHKEKYNQEDIYPGLDHISFTLHKKEKVALIGANGSGKSTLLLNIAGCLKPSKGSIHIMDTDITGSPRKAGAYTGLLFQNPDVQLLLPSVYEELYFALQRVNVPKELIHQKINVLASRFGCSNLLYAPPQRLSSGEKQRVALTVLLALHPALLLLDEPTAALDPKARKMLISLLQQLETALLIATHDLDMALEITNRVLILNKGVIVADGPTKTLLTDAELLEKNDLELPLRLQSSYI